jgi:hypothetical protein
MKIYTMGSKHHLPPVKNCNVAKGAARSRTIRSSFQDLVNNKCTLCILIVTFFNSYLCIMEQIIRSN